MDTNSLKFPKPDDKHTAGADSGIYDLSDNGLQPDSLNRAKVSVPTVATKRITNIVVFYDDNSFESFIPTPGPSALVND